MNTKRMISLSIIMAVIPFFLTPSNRNSEVDTLLNKWEKRFMQKKVISCSLSQKKKIRQLAGETVLEGKLYLKYPRFFRLEIRGDENYDVYCDGETVSLKDLDLEETETYRLEDLGTKQELRQLMPPLLGQSRDEVERNYTIISLPENHLFKVTPAAAASQPFKELYFKVTSLGRIKWMKIAYPNGDWTETTFKNWKQTAGISDDFFHPPINKKSGHDIEMKISRSVVSQEFYCSRSINWGSVTFTSKKR